MGQAGMDGCTKQVFIVGATGPLGSAVARAFAARGQRLVLHAGHNAPALEELASSCRLGGASEVISLVLPCASVADFVESPLLPESPDILVLAWGPWKQASLEDSSTSLWEEMALYNLALPGAMVSRYGPRMARSGWGRLVLFGSSSSDRIQSYRTIAAYAAAKTGLGVLAKSAAREWGGRGVTCNVVCPGYVSLGSGPEIPSHHQKVRGEGLQDPESVARLVIFFCESVNSAINGAILSCGEGI